MEMYEWEATLDSVDWRMAQREVEEKKRFIRLLEKNTDLIFFFLALHRLKAYGLSNEFTKRCKASINML
jgi:hypothetical protein